MNIWHDITDERIQPDQFVACIEISKGSKKKYELDKETGMIILDRVLFTSTHYPANYGFIPKTLAEDGDPLDVLVLCQEDIEPLSLVNCTPIGVIKMRDSDENDEKIIAIAQGDPSLSQYKNVHELPQHVITEMGHFFEVYKSLEGKTTYVLDIDGPDAAKKIISKSIKTYQQTYNK